MLVKILSLFTLLLVQTTYSQVSIKARTLSSTRLKQLAKATDYKEFERILKPILRSRVPGTNGHHFVKEYIINFFKDLDWDVRLDEFDQDTVIGPKRFTNIIATANPNAKKFLLLTAHYDSKIMDTYMGKEFVAATDSAVPCAMMMSIAKSLDLKELKKKNEYTLQLVFFDGEEAFKQWSSYDSIYGSSHLAKVWSQPTKNGENYLSSVEALILLDLIGSKNPRFFSTFDQTRDMFERLHRIENKLRQLGVVSSPSTYFNTQILDPPPQVEDDHIPFLRQGVRILHIIPYPFPECWHQLCDDEQSIDKDTVNDLLVIFKAFFKEMMRV